MSEHPVVDADGRDPAAQLAAWRARGDHRADPVRFGVIEALARRAAVQQQGAARRVLDARVASLLAAYGEALQQQEQQQHVVVAAPTAPAPRSGLADLLAQFADRPADRHADTLDYLRTTWSRLGAERQLAQSLATVPENAGPLNSHHLVHRALDVMRELSPDYLHRFVAYADALLQLDQLHAGQPPAVGATGTPAGRKPAARGKAG